jgi:ABC-type multidrug transport system ATPase subunit/pSer/pThr/pTyr-binding forkhead associated (FHA) protein
MTSPVVTIGRSIGNDIVLMDPKVSRLHARLVWGEGAWHIEKLTHTSAVTVNQRDVAQAVLDHDSTVRLGEDTSFRFLLADGSTMLLANPAARPSAPADPASTQYARLAAKAEQPVASAPIEPATGPRGTVFAPLTELGMPWLEISDHASGTSAKHFLVKETISIGRNARNDITIDAPCVSDQHLLLERQGKQWRLTHPHPQRRATRNGLLYAGRQISGQESFSTLLAPGDVVRIGDAQGALVTLTYREGSETIPPASARMQRIPLGSAEVGIGRARDNALVLDHPQVSAHHARLTREQGVCRLTDLGSTNHIYVNGLRTSSHILNTGDEIRIGPYKLVYEDNLLTLFDESGGVRIDALDLVQTGNNNAILLNDISLSIPPRSFVALVGASGAGKSTLLHALGGLQPSQHGAVYYNGQDLRQYRAAFRSQIGYVPQDEIIHRDLTVERALFYAAKLRLPSDFSDEQIQQRIDEVLDEVEMRHRRTLLIKRLSGGQRKRVSIALELLANPSVFFLDEPTSGLDPGLDRKMMLLLRTLADKGHTIVLVTHATSNINVCDYVCFLAQGGHVAYFGPPDDASAYFAQPGFAEIYSALEPTSDHPDLPSELGKQFAQSSAYQQYIGTPLSSRPAAPPAGDHPAHARGAQVRLRGLGVAWKQFVLLSTRYLELLWNDKKNLAILLLQAPVIAVLLSLFIRELDDGDIFRANNPPITQGDAQKFLFVMTFSAVMFGCINAAREIVKEVPIYQRERAVSLGILPYLFSKITVLGILCLLQCAALIIIISLASPFHEGIILNAFWEVYITLALAALAGMMMGLTISALVPNSDQAMSFIPVVLIPQVVFSGAIFPLKQLYLQVLSVVFVARWAMAAVGSSVHLDSIVLGGDRLFGTCAACVTYRHESQYLLTMWGILVAMILAFTLLTGYLIKRKDTRGQTA